MRNESTQRQHAGAATLLLACLLFGLLLLVSPATALAEDPNNGIPVLYISLTGVGEESPADAFNAINESPDHSVERAGTMRLDVPEGYTGDYSTTALADLDNLQLEYMRGRGNSTWVQDKKPYKIKLETSTDLLGMGASKHWVLIANSIDTSLLRNRIASYLGSELGLAFTPKMLPVDLVVNGTYHGSYFLSEQVRIGNTRVAIDELKPSDTEEPNITGGYLLAMTPKADEPVENRITTKSGVQFCGDDPDFGPSGSGTAAQKAYITDYLQHVEDAIYGDDFRDADGMRWTDYMDQTSTARYWWVQELLSNSPDAFWTPSTYLYKVREGKLYWGPLWDFDQAMASGTNGLTCTQTPWLDYLRSFDPAYQQELRSTWTQLDAILEDVVRQGGVLDQYAAKMRQSWQDDFDVWVKGKLHEPYAKSFDAEVEGLRTWLSARRNWINANIDQELTHVMCKVTFEADGEPLFIACIYAGHNLTVVPAWPQKEGKVFLGWAMQDGSMLDEDSIFESNTTVAAIYADAKDAQLGDGIFLNCYELWMSVDDSPYRTGFTIVPDNSQEQYATWTSSKEQVATVDAYGVVTPRTAGDTVITATLASGASNSYTVHVVESQEQISLDASSIELDRTRLELVQGAYGQARVCVVPQTNSLVLPSYRSRDEKIATVDDNGVVKAIAPGMTIIDVYYPGTEEEEKPSASYEVVVREAEPESSAQKESSTQQHTYEHTNGVASEGIVYTCVAGNDSTWLKGTNDNLVLTFKRTLNDSTTFDHFLNLLVDGKEVDPSSYKTERGSLVVRLKPSYLGTLSSGKHALTVAFDDGSAQASFRVSDGQNGNAGTNASASANDRSSAVKTPRTGDETPGGLSRVVCAIAFILLLVGLLTRRPVQR